MNIKKQLREQIKRSDAEILEKDAAFAEEFKAKYCTEPKRNKKKLVISLSSTFACVVCAVMLILFLPNVGLLNRNDKRLYEIENRATVTSSVQKLNSELEHFEIKDIHDYVYDVELFYDSKYNENLFFRVGIAGKEETVYIEIYVNKEFLDRKNVDGNTETVNNINYEIFRTEEDNKYFDKAEFSVGDIGVYIEYTQAKSEDAPDGFIQFLEQTFSLK